MEFEFQLQSLIGRNEIDADVINYGHVIIGAPSYIHVTGTPLFKGEKRRGREGKRRGEERRGEERRGEKRRGEKRREGQKKMKEM